MMAELNAKCRTSNARTPPMRQVAASKTSPSHSYANQCCPATVKEYGSVVGQ